MDEPTGLRELGHDECLGRLSGHEARVGRLAFVADGFPVVLPVNYTMHRGDVVFRTAIGTKLDHVRRGEPVAFEVDEVDPTWRAGWSVLVQGTAHEVGDLAEVSALQRVRLPTWAAGRRDRFVRIAAERMTGREIVVADGEGSRSG